MKKLLTSLAVLTMAGSAIVTSVYPINNAINAKEKDAFIAEAPIVTETKNSVLEMFDALGETSEFSSLEMYSLDDDTEISGEEYLEMAKEASLELLEGFNNTGKTTSEDLMEYLMVEVPEFKESVEKSQEDYEAELLDKEPQSFNDNAIISLGQEIEVASLDDWQRYMDSFGESIKEAKILEGSAKHVSMVLAVTAAGFWARSIFHKRKIPMAIAFTTLSTLTGMLSKAAREYIYLSEEEFNEELLLKTVLNTALLIFSGDKLLDLIVKVSAGVYSNTVMKAVFGATLSILMTLKYDLEEAKKYREWLSKNDKNYMLFDIYLG